MNFHELLSLPQMGQLKPVAGETGLNRVVHWVYVAECLEYQLQDFTWINGGELIFITGKSIGGDTEQLLRLVTELQRKHAAGLVVNVGPYIPAVPQQVIDAADQSGFPVFELPWNVKLVNITQVICRKIISSELETRSSAHLLETLLFREGADETAMASDLENFGIDLKAEHCIGIIKLCGGNPAAPASEFDAVTWYKKATDLLASSGLRSDRKFLSLYCNSSVVFLTRSTGKTDSLNRILEELNGDPLLAGTGLRAIVGLGGSCAGAEPLRRSYQEAGWALQIMEFEKKTAFIPLRRPASTRCFSRCGIPAC